MRTQKRFAVMFGVTERYADYLFSGQRECSKKLAKAVGERLGVSKLLLLYRVEAGVFSAAEVGAPHLRERLFFLGQLADAERLQGRQRNDFDVLRGRAKEAEQARLGCVHLPDANSGTGQTGPERSGRKARANSDRSGARSELADDDSLRQPQPQGSVCEQRGRTGDFSTWPWPAGRGAEQYTWEKTRLVESSMGQPTDGMGTRNEQLYMLGNGVVPVVAALAFVALLERMNGGKYALV